MVFVILSRQNVDYSFFGGCLLAANRVIVKDDHVIEMLSSNYEPVSTIQVILMLVQCCY